MSWNIKDIFLKLRVTFIHGSFNVDFILKYDDIQSPPIQNIILSKKTKKKTNKQTLTSPLTLVLTDLAAITSDTGRTYAFEGIVSIIHASAIVGTGIFWTGV